MNTNENMWCAPYPGYTLFGNAGEKQLRAY